MDLISMFVLIATAVLLTGLTWMLLALKRSVEKRVEKTERLLDALSNEVQGACQGSIGVGKRTLQLEKHLYALGERLDEMQNNDPARVSYSEAARLVELGASVDDLMNTCGISRPEAELVSALTTKKASDDIPLLTEEA